MAGSGSGLALALDLLRTSATTTKSLHSFSSLSSLSAALAAAAAVTFLPSYPVYHSQFQSRDWTGQFVLCEEADDEEEPWSDSRWLPQWELKQEGAGKIYNVELKPLFSAFKPRALGATTVRACLVNFFSLLEAYIQPEDDDDEDVDRPPKMPVDPIVPMKRSITHILREVSVITTRRILERAAVHYTSRRMAWKLLKDVPKSAVRKAARDITRFELFFGVCKTTFRGHALGVLANWVVQLVLDIYRYIRASFPTKKEEGRKQIAQDNNKDFNRLIRKTAGNTLKIGASLVLASVGAGLGTILIKPSTGTWIGCAAGDLAGPYLIGMWLDVWIFYGTFTP
ncbi:ribosomal RNA-processing protein 1 [Marchantia polymorpha subsp. ruderalis]|uniref:Uncharacterized protein n=1 Tax=Marchantia polymorpha TaxID=3197 RepID=A0A2R6X8K9_MARPO|nr:hypothetical protein MARPO_0030s0146 [Marchantia polymorpha]BBN20310.1 hypothetical protein Mp_8g18130 [Marchantia polymorpha subsp. ruderalis]|eukprot:PTQ42430.1 hypothetical protein MARPO_0030s0146 [Marchantia polymorpha]